MSSPSTSPRPEVGRSWSRSRRIVVDFPAPFGPRKPKISPVFTSRSTPSTAARSPKYLVSPLVQIAASVMVEAHLVVVVGEGAGPRSRCRRRPGRSAPATSAPGGLHRVRGRCGPAPVSYTHLRAHETDSYLVCRLLLEK